MKYIEQKKRIYYATGIMKDYCHYHKVNLDYWRRFLDGWSVDDTNQKMPGTTQISNIYFSTPAKGQAWIAACRWKSKNEVAAWNLPLVAISCSIAAIQALLVPSLCQSVESW